MAKVPAMKLNDGGKIPQLGLGVWQVPDEQAAASVKEALAAGYRSVDTAAIYGNEAGVGAGLRASGVARKDLYITTKLWNDRHGYDDAHKAMDESLGKLGLAYVDLYLIHWPVAGCEQFLEAWRAMIEMKEDGRARSIGVSNFTQANLERLIDASGVTPAVNQIELHPGFTQRGLRAFHARHGIATESWSPLAQGGRGQGQDHRGNRAEIRQVARPGDAALAFAERSDRDSEIGHAGPHPRKHRRLRLRAVAGGHGRH